MLEMASELDDDIKGVRTNHKKGFIRKKGSSSTSSSSASKEDVSPTASPPEYFAAPKNIRIERKGPLRRKSQNEQEKQSLTSSNSPPQPLAPPPQPVLSDHYHANDVMAGKSGAKCILRFISKKKVNQ